jgi:hypothetical protein
MRRDLQRQPRLHLRESISMTSLRTVLELTSSDGRTLYVNVPHIRAVYANGTGASIEFGEGAPLNVRQRAEDIAAKIDRWISAAYLGER